MAISPQPEQLFHPESCLTSFPAQRPSSSSKVTDGSRAQPQLGSRKIGSFGGTCTVLCLLLPHQVKQPPNTPALSRFTVVGREGSRRAGEELRGQKSGHKRYDLAGTLYESDPELPRTERELRTPVLGIWSSRALADSRHLEADYQVSKVLSHLLISRLGPPLHVRFLCNETQSNFTFDFQLLRHFQEATNRYQNG